jgi:hypothetical protein
MANYRRRRLTSNNVKNNVRIEPCSVLIKDVLISDEVTISLKNESEHIQKSPHRLSSLLIPANVTSVTFEGLTYYPARAGS